MSRSSDAVHIHWCGTQVTQHYAAADCNGIVLPCSPAEQCHFLRMLTLLELVDVKPEILIGYF